MLVSKNRVLSDTENQLKEDIDNMNQRMHMMELDNDKLQNSLQDWINVGKNNQTIISGLEFKIIQITNEKRDLEELLTRYEAIVNYRIYSAVPSSELQNVISDIIKGQKDIHLLSRDQSMNERNLKVAIENFEQSKNDPIYIRDIDQLRMQDEKFESQLGCLFIYYSNDSKKTK